MSLQAQLVSEVRRLPPKELHEVMDFVHFLRLRHSIAPDQAYFWTRKWQAMERAVERDKKKGRIIGDGSLKGLFKALGR